MSITLLRVLFVGLMWGEVWADDRRSDKKPNPDFTPEYQELLDKKRIREAEEERQWAEHQRWLNSIDRGGD